MELGIISLQNADSSLIKGASSELCITYIKQIFLLKNQFLFLMEQIEYQIPKSQLY